MAIALVEDSITVEAFLNPADSSAFDTTGGNFIGIWAWGLDGYEEGTISDNKGNSFTALTRQVIPLALWTGQLYYCENAITGSGHIFSVSGTEPVRMLTIAVFSGVKTVSPFYAEEVEIAGNGNTTIQPTAISPNEDGMLFLLGLGAESSTSGATVDQSFAQASYESTGGTQLQYKIQTTAGTVNPTASNMPSSGSKLAHIAAFRPQAAAGIFPPQRRHNQAVKRASFF